MRYKHPGETRHNNKVYVEQTSIIQILQRDGIYDIPMGNFEKEEKRKTPINYLNHDMIFLPIHVHFHWYVAVVNTSRREIQVMDSRVPSQEERNELTHVNYLKLAEDVIDGSSWLDILILSWKVRMVPGLPKQKDSTSCGLFMLKYMEYWNGYIKMFMQEDKRPFQEEVSSHLGQFPTQPHKDRHGRTQVSRDLVMANCRLSVLLSMVTHQCEFYSGVPSL